MKNWHSSLYHSAILTLAASALVSTKVSGTTFTVTNTNPNGAGSFTQAVIDMNADAAEPHVIDFNIAGAGPHTITQTAQIQDIIREVTIDGTTQTGYTVATPMIVLAGGGAAYNLFNMGNGSTGSTITGLVINGFASGVDIQGWNGADSITVSQCFIGTDATGMVAAANTGTGVAVNAADGCQVLNNIISNSGYCGIFDLGGTNGTVIQGNLIGTNLTGTAAFPNAFHGILAQDAATDMVIGGPLITQGNVISGNGEHGIFDLGGSTGLVIQGNKIGTDINGTSAIANGIHGVLIVGDATNLTIGGSNSGEGNVISGNTNQGIQLASGTPSNVDILGNRIGVSAVDYTAIPNFHGIEIAVDITNLNIGGSGASGGNIIFGNNGMGVISNVSMTLNTVNVINNTISGNVQSGMYLFNVNDLVFQGNKIGFDHTATVAYGNGLEGVRIHGSTNAIVGGLDAATRNYFGNNQTHGFRIEDNDVNGMTSDGLRFFGNYVGVAADGVTAMGNGQAGYKQGAGIALDPGCLNAQIGGLSPDSSNVLSSNLDAGIRMEQAHGTVVIGNLIGVGADGSTDAGNLVNGIWAQHANNIQIGGQHPLARNIISGNGEDGLAIWDNNDGSSTNWTVENNFIGVAIDGITPLGNDSAGVWMAGGSDQITIGGSSVAQRNIVANNGNAGVFLWLTSNVDILGNFIGVDSTGLATGGNGRAGVEVVASTAVNVGATGDVSRNIISSSRYGVRIEGGSSDVTIDNNYVGLDSAGSGGASFGSGEQGIWIDPEVGGITDVTISNNWIANSGQTVASTGSGIQVGHLNVTGGVTTIDITGNVIGFEVDGSAAGNLEHGIYLVDTGNHDMDATIGGSTAGDRNVIGNAQDHGIQIQSVNGTTIQGNYIGVWTDGETAAENGRYDIDPNHAGIGLFISLSENTMVGGLNPGEGNVIGNSTSYGIQIQSGGGHTLYGNLIGVGANYPADTVNIGNYAGGILINGTYEHTNPGNHNIIGGFETGAANVIANSTGEPYGLWPGNGAGINVWSDDGATGIENYISQNSIFCNAGIAISLGVDENDATKGNLAQPTPTIDGYSTQDSTWGSHVNPGDTIELYANYMDCGCEAETFIGKTVVEADGSWGYQHTGLSADSSRITVLSRDADGNTSELSGCCRAEAAGLSQIEVNGLDLCESDPIFEVSNIVGDQIEWFVNDGGGFVSQLVTPIVNNLETISVDLDIPVGTYSVRAVVSTLSAEGVTCSEISADFDMNLRASPTLSVNAPPTGCEGTLFDIEATVNSEVDSVLWTIVRGQGTLGDETATSTTYQSVTADADSAVIAITAYAPCESINDTVVLYLNENPAGSFVLDAATVCSGDDATVTFTATAGAAPYRLDYNLDGTNDFADNVNSGDDFTFAITGASNITYGSITDANNCVTAISESIDMSAFPTLSVTPATFDCISSTEYTVSFTISGGDAGSYNVAGGTGTLTGGDFVSDQLPNGAYSFTVTDGNGCESIDVSGNNSCDCTTAVDDITGTEEACADAAIAWTFDENTQWTNDGDDVLIYVLHEGASRTIVNPIDTLTSFTLSYDVALTFGNSYYISPVAGSDNGSGLPDPSDICYQVGAGLEVIFHEVPTISIDDAAICAGESVTLDPQPWTTYNWSTGATIRTIDHTPSSTETVSVSITDANGCATQDAATITVNSLPNPSLSDQEICEDGTARLDVGTFAGYLWSDNSIAQTLETSTAGTYSVTVTNAAGCEGQTSAEVTVRPSANISFATSAEDICQGEELAFDLDITQTAGTTFDVSLTNDNVNFVDYTDLATGPNTITLTPGDDLYPTSSSIFTFTIEVTDAAGCDQTPDLNNNQTVVNVKAVPTVTAPDNLVICNASDANAIEFTLLGSTDYTLYLSYEGTAMDPIAVTGSPYELTDPATGTYLVDSLVGDNGCPANDDEVVEVEVLNDPVESASFDYVAAPSCNGVAVTISNVSNADIYAWDFGPAGTSTDADPGTIFFDDIDLVEISLDVQSVNGCQDTTSLGGTSVTLFQGDYNIPNVFTPGDNDGLNDYLTLDPNDFYDGCVHFIVYDRWGIQIFDNEADLSTDQWDGTSNLFGGLAPEGTYYYIYSINDAEMEPKSVSLFR